MDGGCDDGGCNGNGEKRSDDVSINGESPGDWASGGGGGNGPSDDDLRGESEGGGFPGGGAEAETGRGGAGLVSCLVPIDESDPSPQLVVPRALSGNGGSSSCLAVAIAGEPSGCTET
eukprot:Hpha_TRINITY_DN15519_c0_g1::TRINITY_DN15519_c0_g1_i1::g.105011::m.105011